MREWDDGVDNTSDRLLAPLAPFRGRTRRDRTGMSDGSRSADTPAQVRDAARLQKQASEAEKAIARLQEAAAAVDRAMFEPASARAELAQLTMGELSRRRAGLTSELESAELQWIAASEQLEQHAG